MNINLRNFHVPVAWLALTNIIFVLAFVPLIRKGLFPCLEKFNINLSNAGKISIGRCVKETYFVCNDITAIITGSCVLPYMNIFVI